MQRLIEYEPTSKLPPTCSIDGLAKRLGLTYNTTYYFFRRLTEVEADGKIDTKASQAYAERFHGGLDRPFQRAMLGEMLATFQGPKSRYKSKVPLVRKLLEQVERDEREESLQARGRQAALLTLGNLTARNHKEYLGAIQKTLTERFGWEEDEETARVAEESHVWAMHLLGQLPGMVDRLPPPFGSGR